MDFLALIPHYFSTFIWHKAHFPQPFEMKVKKYCATTTKYDKYENSNNDSKWLHISLKATQQLDKMGLNIWTLISWFLNITKFIKPNSDISHMMSVNWKDDRFNNNINGAPDYIDSLIMVLSTMPQHSQKHNINVSSLGCCPGPHTHLIERQIKLYSVKSFVGGERKTP